ncbi:MAG: IS3 family transposase, partial [Bacteroidales bacterium]|nr:IS3 family transposase [Bacteroidales bacterium]
MQELRLEHDLEILLEKTGMARSTYYYHTKRLSEPDGYDAARAAIHKIYDHHKGRYGYRRITIQLCNDGIHLNHKTVQKLMVQMGLYGKRKKAKYKSYKGEVGKIAPNVIDRYFIATAPNQKWTTDVTEVKIKDKKMYLSPILDMFNGEIISYTISYHPDLKMAMSMLNKAFKKTYIPKGLILHSDQGWHYQHLKYQKALKGRSIIQSMSRKGN